MPDGLSTGLDALRAHVPSLRTKSGTAGIVALALAVFGLTSAFFILADERLPEWMPDGEIVVLALGFLILSRFFSLRERYQQRFGEQAYARALTAFVLPGAGVIYAALLHLVYMAGPSIPAVSWRPIVIALGWLFLARGVLLWWRAVNVLGLDNVALLYVYHPEKRRMIESGMYSLLRHPIYAAGIQVSLGLALIHANWYALLVALIVPLFFLAWVILVEERELMAQLPEYREYRRRVPALLPRIRDWPRFWRFLLAGR